MRAPRRACTTVAIRRYVMVWLGYFAVIPGITMKQTTILFAAIALAPFLHAQQVAVSLSSPNPLVMSSTGTGAANNWQIPGGQLANFGYYAPQLAGAGPAFLTWTTQAASTIAALSLHQQISAGAGVTASVGENEFLFIVSATAPINVTLKLESLLHASAGVAIPAMTVDVGDDGMIDYTQATVFYEQGFSIGNSPLPIRITMENEVAATGLSWSSLFVTVKPQNNLVIQPAAIGCTGASPDLFCDPTFVGAGVEFVRQPLFSLPAVVVLGLGVQPMLLPISTPVAPCLLLPRPDAVITLFANSHTVLIPPAVRPVTFWGQGVALDQVGTLLAMDGYRIVAQ